MNTSTLIPPIAQRTALCSRALRLLSREVDGWYLIIGSLVRGYTG